MLQDDQTDSTYKVQTGPALLKTYETLCFHSAEFQPGDNITAHQALAACSGIVGIRSVRTALKKFAEIVESPSPAPPTPVRYALQKTGNSVNQHMRVSSPAECEKNKSGTRGRPAKQYQIPTIDHLSDHYNAPDCAWITPLDTDALSSTKNTRTRLLESFIERKPGNWSNKFHQQRLKISHRTLKRYKNSIDQFHESPAYQETPVFWSNVNKIEFCDQMEYGIFLQDQYGNKFPALKVIAIGLLRDKIRFSLFRQLPNHQQIGRPVPKFKPQIQKFAQNQQDSTFKPAVTARQNAPEQPATRHSEPPTLSQHEYTESRYSGTESDDSDPDMQRGERVNHLLQQILSSDMTRRSANRRANHIINSNYSDEFTRDHILNWFKGELASRNRRGRGDNSASSTSDTRAAQIQQRINSAIDDTAKHISQANSAYLIDVYGEDQVLKAIDAQQRRGNIHSPVGWIFSYLRSSHTARMQ
jgi:hypothetical protein